MNGSTWRRTAWSGWPARCCCPGGGQASCARRPQGPAAMRWWKSDQFQKDLGLTADQVAKVDAIFEATLPELRQRKDELDRLESKLSRLIEGDTDEVTVAHVVDKTEAARGSLNKTAHADADADASGAQAGSARAVQGACTSAGIASGNCRLRGDSRTDGSDNNRAASPQGGREVGSDDTCRDSRLSGSLRAAARRARPPMASAQVRPRRTFRS